MAMVLGQEDKPAAIAVAMRAIQAQFAPPLVIAPISIGTVNGTHGASGSRLGIAHNVPNLSQAAAAGPALRKAAAAAVAAAVAPAGPKEAAAKATVKPEVRKGTTGQPAVAAAVVGPGVVAKAAGVGKAKKAQTGPAVAVAAEAAAEDVTKFLDDFPATKRMLERFHAVPATENKTALSLVHEYAARLLLDVSHLPSGWHQ